jgi:hypothetical protein
MAAMDYNISRYECNIVFPISQIFCDDGVEWQRKGDIGGGIISFDL